MKNSPQPSAFERNFPFVMISAALLLASAFCFCSVRSKQPQVVLPPKSTTSLVVTTIDTQTGEIMRKLTSPMPAQSPTWSVTADIPDSGFLTVGYFEKGQRFTVHLWRNVETKKGPVLIDVADWQQSASIGFAKKIGAYTVVIDLEVNP